MKLKYCGAAFLRMSCMDVECVDLTVAPVTRTQARQSREGTPIVKVGGHWLRWPRVDS